MVRGVQGIFLGLEAFIFGEGVGGLGGTLIRLVLAGFLPGDGEHGRIYSFYN